MTYFLHAFINAPTPIPDWFVHTPHPDQPSTFKNEDHIEWSRKNHETRYWQWREYFAKKVDSMYPTSKTITEILDEYKLTGKLEV